ncbi:hypothetical protein HXX76_006762 [Chlamydomonas incerta]|uniref:Uncharacterized protein n=1 Tax=Chlamydomonas incerta TaxID=51695 RepID=A0A835T9W5_CHLIN|nr:hypothetical protein HXX76_006762 [Chlamydomonas incerta]|eukprot:KAG2436459.1 hypothetical protein HXX76_006762 [Chlamydomonas incerta]
MFLAPRLPADENAGVGGTIKLRSGLGGGLRGIGSATSGPLKPLASATNKSAAPGGPSKPGQAFSAQPRAILGNLTNTAKPSSASSALTSGKAKQQSLQPQAVSIENAAGKSWKAQERDRAAQEAHTVTTRVNRTIAAVSTWKTAPFFILADEDASDASEVDEPVRESEAPIVVQLHGPGASNRGNENVMPPAAGSSGVHFSAGARLPDLGAGPLDLAFDFDTEDEDAALL